MWFHRPGARVYHNTNSIDNLQIYNKKGGGNYSSVSCHVIANIIHDVGKKKKPFIGHGG